ncbi:MAG: geranylgeranyl reductase family protein [Candidatus Bathyarchaeia archaeon]
MTDSSDVIVVGAGPCGSYSALVAAKLGMDVVVCEEHEEIGVPAHCLGHLSLSGLKRLGLTLPTRVVENEFKGAVFYSPSGKRVKIKLSSPVTCVVNRKSLDKHLAELALRAGAQYQLQSRVESLDFKRGLVKGVIAECGSSRQTLTSKIVIDAEGVRSSLLKKAGIQTLDRSMVLKGVEAEVERTDDLDRDMVEVYFGQRYAPGLFAWIAPKGDGSAKIGLATKRGNPREYLYRFMQKHPIASRKLRKSEITDLSFHPLSLGGPIPKTYSSQLLIVGDAASQVKPTTGGGVIFGLLSSQIAGEVAYEAVQNDDFSEGFLSLYERRWKEEIGFDFWVMRQLRKLLDRLSDKQMDKAISLCSRLRVNTVLEEVGDLDFQGRSLIHMLRHPNVLALVFHSLFSSLTSLA